MFTWLLAHESSFWDPLSTELISLGILDGGLSWRKLKINGCFLHYRGNYICTYFLLYRLVILIYLDGCTYLRRDQIINICIIKHPPKHYISFTTYLWYVYINFPDCFSLVNYHFFNSFILTSLIFEIDWYLIWSF